MSRSDIQKRPPRGRMRGLLRDARSLLCFFAALLIVELLFTVLFASVATDAHTIREEVADRYDYELEYRSMTQPQYAQLYNMCGETPPEDEVWRPYSSIRYEKEDDLYNAYVTLRGTTPKDAAAYFLHLYAIDGVAIGYSPLYDYRAQYLPDIVGFTVLCAVAMLALCVGLLVLLYRRRLDRDTFAFGIYMTCGATFSRLYGLAVLELLAIGVLTLAPALALGYLITALLYAPVGVAAQLSPGAILLTVALSVATVLLATLIPVRRLSRTMPTALLASKDNTPYVVSPRRSVRLFGAAYPRTYQGLALVRTRRYVALLMIACVVLPGLLVAAFSLADAHETRRIAAEPDFTVTFSPEVVNPPVLLDNTAELAGTIGAIEGVKMCLPDEITRSLSALCSHMVVSDSNTVRAKGLTVPFDRAVSVANADRYTHATNAAAYLALDEAAIAALSHRYADIEGDLSSVLTRERTVVLTESLNNQTPFRFEVGDTVLLATTASAPQMLFANRQDLLRLQLSEGRFTYEVYTVGAVIHDTTAESALRIGVSTADYEALTGEAPVRTGVSVYLEEDADFAVWQTVSDAVYDAAYDYYHCTVENHHVFFGRYLTTLRNVGDRIRVLGLCLGAMALVLAFHSQRIFYDKRAEELWVLRALGSSRRDTARIFWLDALCLAGLSVALTLPLSLLADRLLFRLIFEWLPAGGFLPRVVASYTLSPAPVVTAVILALVTALVPPLVALARYRKQQNQTIGGYGDVSEKR